MCLLDPDDSQRPKPTSNAIPMPAGMNKKAVSINNRQDGVPSQDQPFHDNPEFKWLDFFNMDMPPPGYLSSKIQPAIKLKVDFNKPDQLYYYLGELSTDAKSFFTDKPGSNQIVAKANFMERVQPPRPVYQYQAPRQALAAAYPGAAAIQKQNHNRQPGIQNHKPYVYKPREPTKPSNAMWQIDQQSLANQRNFLMDSAGSHQSPQQFSGFLQQMPQPNLQGSDTPLRSFPNDQYYSMKTLPAAYPGQHSGFTQAARRESSGSQTMQRPGSGYVPNYQSVKEQQAQRKQSTAGAPQVPMMGSNAASPSSFPPNPYGSNGSRPTSSAHSHQSPYGAPLTPATTHSHASASKEGPPTDEEYLANLRKYNYLLKSYCRKPKVYESPYPLGGGFSEAYQPLLQSKSDGEAKHGSFHTPQGSVSSITNNDRPQSQQWTPPSQRPQASSFSSQQTPPPPSQVAQQPARPYPIYSTPQEFQRQIQSMPSTASRDGAQARMLRDQGYMPYPQHTYHRNSFGQPYDTAKMWNSPKAPTVSPLSDPNTPGQGQGPGPGQANMRGWGMLPRPEGNPLQRPVGGGYGPMLPQMHGAGQQ